MNAPSTINGVGRFAEETLRSLADQVGGLERKVAKQRKRLDRLTGRGDHGGKAAMGRPGRRGPHRESTALDLIGAAEREAAEIRRAARREREDFRAELVGLLSRFAPVEDEFDNDE